MDVFGNVEERGKKLQKDLSELEAVKDSHDLTVEEK